MDVVTSFQAALARAEADLGSAEVHDIWDSLRTAIPREVEYESLIFELKAELFVFSLSGRHWTRERAISHENYYIIISDEENEQHPLLVPGLIQYLSLRAKECHAPTMRLRYADVAWDLAGRIKNSQRSVEMASELIKATVELGERANPEYVMHRVNEHARAISVAQSIKDEHLVDSVIQSLVALEDSHAHDNLPGTCGFAFDILWSSKLFRGRPALREKITTDLRNRFRRICDLGKPTEFDPHHALLTARRLARMHRIEKHPEMVREVLVDFSQTIVAFSKEISPLLGIHWLQEVDSLLREFELHDEAKRVLAEMPAIAEQSHRELCPISYSCTIPWEQLDGLTAHLMDDSPDTSLHRIAKYFLPDVEHNLQQLHKQEAEFPLSALFGSTILGFDGLPVASVSPSKDDEEGRLVQFVSKGFQLNAPYLRFVIRQIVSRFSLSAEFITAHIAKSRVFGRRQHDQLFRGFSAYLNSDAVVAIHLLIPQLESGIRRLIEIQGGVRFKNSRRNSEVFENKTFEMLLRDDLLVKAMGTNAQFYFRVLFTDPRGWNMRNIVCHGMAPDSYFDYDHVDRVFHAILVMASLRWKTN